MSVVSGVGSVGTPASALRASRDPGQFDAQGQARRSDQVLDWLSVSRRVLEGESLHTVWRGPIDPPPAGGASGRLDVRV